MHSITSSLYNAILIVVAFTSTVQRTAAQTVLCGQYQNFSSASGQYIIQNNLWGADGSGSQCTTVEDELNGTAFSTTWIWGANSTYVSQTQVHSYANVKSNSTTLPVMLSSITSLNVSASWTMYPSGPVDLDTFDLDGLSDIGAKADVTLDFFLDPDMKESTSVTNPKFEVMIWFASLDSTEPIGYVNGSVGSIMMDGQNYTLFAGTNEAADQRQEVFSFVAPENLTSFSELDVLPLFQYLMDGNRMDSSIYLGTAQFGTEAFHTDGKNVTFSASGINLTVDTAPIPSSKSNPSSKPNPSSKSSPSSKPNAAPKKSIAVSLKGPEGLKWCLGLLEGAVGAWILWSWML